MNKGWDWKFRLVRVGREGRSEEEKMLGILTYVKM